MQVSFTPSQLTELSGARESRGATEEIIRGIAALAEAQPGDLSFLGNAKYKAQLASTRASVLLLPMGHEGTPPANQLWLLVDNPSVALARVCARLESALWPRPEAGIHPSAVVASDASIDPSAAVGPLCVIESGARIGARAHLQAHVFVGRASSIGEDCWLMPGSVLAAECSLGRRVRLHPGVVVGSDGFGYEFVQGRHEKVPQVGTVQIEDDVEIGANSTLDRARFGVTRVGEGTKIDNLVQVGHNVRIGRHCLLCAQVGIAGSSTLGDYVVLGGQAGVGGHVTLGKGTKAGGRAGISTDLSAGSFVNGNPAIPYLLERRVAVLQPRLPELFRRVGAIEEQLGLAKKSSS